MDIMLYLNIKLSILFRKFHLTVNSFHPIICCLTYDNHDIKYSKNLIVKVNTHHRQQTINPSKL